MVSVTFESVGIERGVLALEAMSQTDWGGLAVGSFGETNAPGLRVHWQHCSPPLHDVDATLSEAFDRYDNLLRRLAD